MHTILVGTSALTDRMVAALLQVLGRDVDVCFVGFKKIWQPRAGADVLIGVVEGGAVVEAPQALLLLPADSPLPDLASPLTLVADSARESWPRDFAGQLISCGPSAKDTLTLSSRTADAAVVALMRRINSLSGQVVEPCEIPLLFGEGDPFLAFGVVSALLLTDRTALLGDLSNQTNNLQL